MKNDHSETKQQILPEALQVTSRPHAADTEKTSADTEKADMQVDTARIQAALEKRADQETAELPQLTLPNEEETDILTKISGNSTVSEISPEESSTWESDKPVRKKRRTGHSVSERWWTPSVRSWFFTFMCMNMPVIGWFYLFHKARHEEDPARKEFARAYLFYKLVFLIAGAVVLLILIWIGLGLLDQLLAYMEML